MATDEEIAQARAKLEDEYQSVMNSLGELHVAVEALKRAGVEDDVADLLKAIEDEAKKARTGGIIGSGAKGHARALDDYREATRPST